MEASYMARREIEQALHVATMQGPGRFTLYTIHKAIADDRERQSERKLTGRYVWTGTYDWDKWKAHHDIGDHEKPDIRTCRECGKAVKGAAGLRDHIRHKHGQLEQAA